ncbi:MAG: hypothetical protein J0M11_18415 [Anaerolineae bacterium]|nr:hypothetical protein [Anaerolineae bacterium]
MDKPIMETPLHPSAQSEIIDLITKDTERLIMQSKIVASITNSPAVLSNHVEDAHSILNKRSDNSKTRDAILILGSTFLGASLPGFIESAQNANISGITIWVIAGIIGIILTMFGLWGMSK